MRLSNFILEDLDSILEEWDSFAHTIEPAALSMTSKELRNHAAVMLKTIAEDLVTPQSREQQIAKSHGQGQPGTENGTAEQHGLARLESRFTIEQLVSEYRALRASVLRLWTESNKSPSATDIEDITRFNEAIDELLAGSIMSFAQAVRQAEAAEKQRRDQFLAMLAHELRNPLSPISAAASLLKIAKGDEEIAEKSSDIITRQVAHMTTLVNDLLDVSRVTRGLIELNMEPLDMRLVLDDAVEQVTPLIQARRHQLTVTAFSQPIIVQGDKKRLVQVLTNLLANAVKYTPEGGRLCLKTELQNEQVVITVEDNGIGMAPELIPHVFELFAQAERTSDRASGGLGLGLALVKSLTGLHGGKVACSSPGLGKGSQFTVWLPRQFGREDQVERRRTPRTQLSAGKSLKILVVDDNVDAAQMLGLLLKTAGHQVITEHDATRVLDVARTERPDTCLLDIGLPEIDGYELARRLRAHPETADILLIALTGYGQVRDRDEAIAAGFDYHMTKPVDTAKLQAVLATPV